MRVLLSLLVAAGLGFAQTGKAKPRRVPKKAPATATASAETTAWRLESVVVEGAKLWKPETILAVAGLKPGALAGRPEFDKARDRLVASGYFESVAYKYEPGEGGAIRGSFQVAEVQQVYAWRLEDLPVRADEFSAVAAAREPLFGPRIPATQPVIDRYLRILESMLTARKFTEPVMGKVVSQETPPELVVLFRPKTPPPSVAEVSFTGVKTFDVRDLQKAIGPVAVGSIYTEPRFRQFLDTTIRSIYETKGKMRVKFPKVTTEPSTTAKGVSVTVDVEEGETFRLKSVQVNGTPYDAEENEKEGEFHPGETVNYSEIGKGLERILKRLRNSGYLNAAYKAARKIDDKEKTAEFFVDVTRGQRYTFRKLTIKGLDIETEPAVRKLYTQQPEDPFNASYPEYFLDRIRADGLLDFLGKTKAVVTPDDKSLTVDVLLIFEGEKLQKKVER